jgi:hypothetical protein
VNAQALRARREALVARASLQRVRLWLEIGDLQRAVAPPRWAAPALGAALLAVALRTWLSARRADRNERDDAARHGSAPRAASWPLWSARALAFWRVALLLRRLWLRD